VGVWGGGGGFCGGGVGFGGGLCLGGGWGVLLVGGGGCVWGVCWGVVFSDRRGDLLENGRKSDCKYRAKGEEAEFGVWSDVVHL